MNSYRKQIALFVFALSINGVGLAAGAGGNQDYTPSALEWLNLNCMSMASQKSGFYSTCSMEKPNTIKIVIGYWDESKKKQAEDEFIPISYLLTEYAKEKGWSWLKIIKEVSHIKPK